MQLKDYGDARQITLFEHGQVVLQILTSDFRCVPGADPGLAEVPVAGGELPQVRQRELRHRQDLRLHSPSIEANTKIVGQPGPQEGQCRRPRGGKGRWPPPNGTWPCCSPTRRITPGRQERQADPRRAGRDHRRAQETGRRRRGPRRHPRETARQPHRPRSPGRAAAHRPPRPADGAAAARAQRRALAIEPPQRLPARRRRIPRHHPPDHHPRPGRHHHLSPPARSPSPSSGPPPPASPAPWPCSSTRSTPPRPPCPATPGPSPTSSPPQPGI